MSEENTTTTAAAAALRRTARIYQGQEEDVYRLYSKLVPPLFLLWTVQSVLLHYILSYSSVSMSAKHTACTRGFRK